MDFANLDWQKTANSGLLPAPAEPELRADIEDLKQ